jgi:hypothetical protein
MPIRYAVLADMKFTTHFYVKPLHLDSWLMYLADYPPFSAGLSTRCVRQVCPSTSIRAESPMSSPIVGGCFLRDG